MLRVPIDTWIPAQLTRDDKEMSIVIEQNQSNNRSTCLKLASSDQALVLIATI